MNAIAFSNLYSGLKTDKEKESFILKHFSKSYVPIKTKVAVCKKIISESNNAVLRHVIYFLELFKLYTDIEISSDISVEDQYDALRKYNLIDLVIALISETEFIEFNYIYNIIMAEQENVKEYSSQNTVTSDTNIV